MFRNSDFDIFEDKTLNGRMEKIRTIIDPKFEEFASIVLPILNTNEQEWYAHVAKHLRRTTYAPDNTWVAFTPNKRGYKMLPHFELGIWEDNVYFYLAVEENMKPDQTNVITQKLREVSPLVRELPDSYRLSQNHMVNKTYSLLQYDDSVERYESVKHSEVLIGVEIKRGDKLLDGDGIVDTLVLVMKNLLPIYEKIK
ncbi:DUF1054 domain-containing protein [Leuconostoc mesenteroides]|uniref:DUF1054 domain-containing protein n=1 Tax=Leuconostoc mesenteroides TaxID=1245 RepID=UPI0021A38836|nr:DUF1054 domain-containing protein [Leuconostoc mesenteroides]MCT3045390.1 DUF1054 domain-containing protein [Leuconostoc mesenteroides]